MPDNDSNPRSQQIDAAIAEYLEAIERGSPPDYETFLAQHADIADGLREFLADYSALKGAALQPVSSDDETTDPSNDRARRAAAANGNPLDVIRYFGDYELVEEIARGGMGVVYKARQRTLGRTVAVKMILSGQLASQTDVDRFYAEAQAVATLDHPHIVPIFEVGQHQGQHYFSMGYVEGGSLATKIAAGPMPPREAAQLLLVVCRAVQYAHEHGVVHRDLKPGNILLDSQGHPRVTDFGLAKCTGADRSLTASGQILGTPSYMPPEQAAGQIVAIGPASDVYSLGAILYAMLTGRPPFQAASSIDTLRQVMEREPLAPRQLNPDIPRDLQTIALKCLEKSIARRYATSQLLGDELLRFLEGRPILARPVSRTERVVRWGRRNPVLAAALLAAMTMLGAVLVGGPFLLWRVDQARKVALQNLDRATIAEAQAVVNLGRAKVAEADSKQKLADSYLEQAQAVSASRRSGQRFKSLDAVRKAQKISGPTRDLADAAVAALCLPDMVISRQWPGNPKGVHTMAFDPDLEKYARADDESVSVRRVKDDREIAKIAIKDVESSTGLVFSSDGQYLHVHRKSASPRSMLYRIEADSIRCLMADDYDSFAFSPDSKSLAAWYPDHTLRILGLPECRESKRFELPNADIDLMRWNPRYNRLLVRFSNRFWAVFDMNAAVLGPTVPLPLFGMAWHPDGQRVAAPSNATGAIQVFDTLRMQPASGVMKTPGVGGVHTWFSRRGDLLVNNDWSLIRRMWDPDGGSELLSTPANDTVSGFVFGPDDLHLAASTLGEMVQIWQIAPGSEERIVVGQSGDFDADYYRYRPVISPDGRWLAAGTQVGISIVDILHGCEIKSLRTGQPTVPVGIDDRGQVRVTVSGRLLLFPTDWNVDTNEIIMGASEQRSPVGYAGSGDQSSDGRVVAIARRENIFIINPAADSGTTETPSGPYDFRGCAVSPDGKLVASGSHWPAGGGLANACVWDSKSGKLVQSLPGGELCATQFSPRGKWLATRSTIDNICQLWKVSSWEAGPHFATASMPAFSADDSLIALGMESGQVQLIETATGRSFATLTSRELTPLQPEYFSPDGTLLIALATESGSLHIWNLAEIHIELRELGLDQGWPEMPAPKGIDQLPPRIHVQRQSQLSPMNSEIFQEVMADVTSQAAISPYSPYSRVQLGNELARRAQWAAAEKSFNLAATLAFPTGLCAEGLVQIADGADERYRQLCQFAVSHCVSITDSQMINEVVRLCTLAPQAQGDWSTVTKLLERAAQFAADNRQRGKVALMAAMIECRKGNNAEAIILLDRAMSEYADLPPMQRGQALLFKAIAQAADGRGDEAKASLASADKLCQGELATAQEFDLGPGWLDLLLYKRLHKELTGTHAKEQTSVISE